MSADDCQLKRVAEGGCCAVYRCEDCGRYLLQVGPVSVRVPAAIVRELHRCLCEAMTRSATDAANDEPEVGAPMRAAPLRH